MAGTDIINIKESLPRLTKLAIDTGEVSTIEAAIARFRGYQLAVSIGELAASNPIHQTTLLTLVNLARRCFLGGIQVAGVLDAPLLCDLPLGKTLADAVKLLGGQVVRESAPETPLVLIGRDAVCTGSGFAVRTTYEGWRAGIAPADQSFSLKETGALTIAGVLAAALAANEAFSYFRRDTPEAGFRRVGLSLWDLNADWIDPKSNGPEEIYLPSNIWVLGLGHLGQAYLWALASLPYSDAGSVEIILQDVDKVSPSTESTSVLTDRNMVGKRKTRVLAEWLEARGFKTTLVERFFDGSLVRQSEDPQVLLSGVDNAWTRKHIDRVGFPFVVDAGIGKGVDDFRSISVHTFPSSRSAEVIWSSANTTASSPDLNLPAYKVLRDAGVDQCGLTLLAETAVGAPFVGGVASTLVIAELLKLLLRGTLYSSIDLDLRAVRHRIAVPNSNDFSRSNTGFLTSR